MSFTAYQAELTLMSTSPGMNSSHFCRVRLTSGSWAPQAGEKVREFIFTSLPDCIARDSKSRVISTKASFTLMKLVNAAGLPGCLSGWLLYDFFLKATLTSLRREELICDGALQSYLILEEGDMPRIL